MHGVVKESGGKRLIYSIANEQCPRVDKRKKIKTKNMIKIDKPEVMTTSQFINNTGTKKIIYMVTEIF